MNRSPHTPIVVLWIRPLVSVVVSFPSVLDRSQPFAHGAAERGGRGGAPGGRASDDLLSGRD